MTTQTFFETTCKLAVDLCKFVDSTELKKIAIQSAINEFGRRWVFETYGSEIEKHGFSEEDFTVPPNEQILNANRDTKFNW